jgi:hypothetical protein
VIAGLVVLGVVALLAYASLVGFFFFDSEDD